MKDQSAGTPARGHRKKKPTRSRPRSTTKPKKFKVPPLSQEDRNALDAFCAKIKVDEISQESWELAHRDLVLRIPLWIAPSEARTGVGRDLVFTRTVVTDSQVHREKVQFRIDVPPGAKDGDELRFNGIGDWRDGLKGDLFVLVRVKSDT